MGFMDHLLPSIPLLSDFGYLSGYLVPSIKPLILVILDCESFIDTQGFDCILHDANDVELVLSPGLLALVYESAKFFGFNWVMWRICMLF